MATIVKSVDLGAPADEVWDALRDFGALHERLVRGFVTDTRLGNDDTRIVTFTNGAVARERLVTIDDDARRLVYTVVHSPLGATHDNSAAQVLPLDGGGARFVWTKDVLPNELAPRLSELMDAGIAAIRATFAEMAGSPTL